MSLPAIFQTVKDLSGSRSPLSLDFNLRPDHGPSVALVDGSRLLAPEGKVKPANAARRPTVQRILGQRMPFKQQSTLPSSAL